MCVAVLVASHCAFMSVASPVFGSGPCGSGLVVSEVPCHAWIDASCVVEAADGVAVDVASGYVWCPACAFLAVLVVVATGFSCSTFGHLADCFDDPEAECDDAEDEEDGDELLVGHGCSSWVCSVLWSRRLSMSSARALAMV